MLEMDERAITDRLNTLANEYAASRGYRFGDGAQDDILHMAEEASEALLAKKFNEALLEANIRMTEGEFMVFIENMIIGAQYPDILGEDTFKFAKRKLGPMWPLWKKHG
jgi:hypothetical protein